MQMANVLLCAFIHDGFPSFYYRQENCQLYFLCPLLTYLSKIAAVTGRTEGLFFFFFSLVWAGSGGWNLKQKYSADIQHHSYICFLSWYFLMNLCTFAVNISFFLEELNDYLLVSFGFYCLSVFT